MSVRANRFVAVVAIAAVILAVAVIMCAGPAHILMGGSDAGDGLCALGGHGASVGLVDSTDIGPAAVQLIAVVFAGLVLAAMGLLAIQGGLPEFVQGFAADDQLHGRLSI